MYTRTVKREKTKAKKENMQSFEWAVRGHFDDSMQIDHFNLSFL